MTIQKIEAQSPEAQSADRYADNIAMLKELFPEQLTESSQGAAINVDVLKEWVGDNTATDAEEKYGLIWHGKRRARQLAPTPSTGTLRPCPEQSVDWETTQNLMIEGDNLEVLKLLQKSYAGKMDFYLNLLNDRERAPDDQASIGIILCAEKDDVEVEYALKSKVNPIGVAEYQLQARLPAEFKGQLPTARQLAGVVRGALPRAP